MSADPSRPAAADAAPHGADDEVPWLSEDERDTWLEVWSIVLQLPTLLEAQLQRDADLGLFDYMVMAWLSMIPEHQSRMGELAKLTGGSMSRLSNVVKRLENRGRISRHPDPANGRFIIATLTAAGHDAVVAAAPGHVRAVRRYVFEPLDTQQVDLLRSIGGSIADRIRSDSDGDPDLALVAGDCDTDPPC